jgi:hypothetical protein
LFGKGADANPAEGHRAVAGQVAREGEEARGESEDPTAPLRVASQVKLFRC